MPPPSDANSVDEPPKPCIYMNAAENELGGICFTSELGDEPCVRFACGHVFHANCVLMMLSHRWSTLKISFGYLDCPSCKQEILLDYEVPILSAKLTEQINFKLELKQLAFKMAKEEGYDKEEGVQLLLPNGNKALDRKKFEAFALHNCTFFECHQCKKPYFGGMQDCLEAMQQEDELKKEDLLCKNCMLQEAKKNADLGWG